MFALFLHLSNWFRNRLHVDVIILYHRHDIFQYNIHESFMARAIELSKRGMGLVSPNPLVGCVLVKDGQIIGEGFHEKYGDSHAEVMAYNNYIALGSEQACRDHGKLSVEGKDYVVKDGDIMHFRFNV